MVPTVLSTVHDHEPNVVWGDSSHSDRRILSDRISLAIATPCRDRFKRTDQEAIERRGLDHKINRSVEVRQQSFTLILPSLLDYFHERGYFWTRSIARFNTRVKASLIEQRLVFKGFPYFKERSLLIQLDRVVSEWVTRTILGRSRHRETKHNCEDRDVHCHRHIQHAFIRENSVPSGHAAAAQPSSVTNSRRLMVPFRRAHDRPMLTSDYHASDGRCGLFRGAVVGPGQ